MFSVLISVYAKEKAKYFKKALESIMHQSLPPAEIVLVEDGKLTEELYQTIDEFSAAYCKSEIKKSTRFLVETHRDSTKVVGNTRLVRVSLREKCGLGKALAEGLQYCSYDLVARMDSDDISEYNRFEKEYAFMKVNPQISVIGSDIAEFIEEGKEVRRKSMPIDSKAIRQYAKYRNPLNHMSVMFRKSDVEEVGGYMELAGLEDYYLWLRLLAKGRDFVNIPEALIRARIGGDFAKRRGGFAYFKNYLRLRHLENDLGLFKGLEYPYACFLTLLMTLQPRFLRNVTYKILRRR